MTTGTVNADLLGVGWTALRAFFSEGMPALQRAVEAFERAESLVRSSGDPDRLTLWLLGTTTALRYSRRPEPMETGLARARELVNLVSRTQSETATISYRTLVEGLCRDLAWVVPAQAGVYLDEGLEYSDRTVRLAKAAARDEWLAQARASRGDLLLQRATDRKAMRRAASAHEDARRRWPARDAYGKAQAALGYGAALLALGEHSKVDVLAREVLQVFQAQGDRYHLAGAHLLLARALYAQDQSDALDEHAAALAVYRALGCRWELARAEAALA